MNATKSLNNIFRWWIIGLVLLTIGLSFVSATLYIQTQRLYKMNEFNLLLHKDSAALVMLANERLVYDTGRFNKQLEDASNNLKLTLFESKSFISDDDADILLVYLADIRFLLGRYLIYQEHPANEKIRRSAFDGIMSKIYGLDSEINRITHEGQAHFQSIAQIFTLVLFAFLTVLFLVPILVLTKLRQQLLGALQEVAEATRRMIGQKFQEEVPNTSLLEVNQLVWALNDLRKRLTNEMASRQELEREVDLRTHAESEVRNLLKELQHNHKKLLQMEKLSALGTMVGGVAHELNNPLMGILNYVQYSKTRCANERAQEMLGRAEEEVVRIQALVTNMLVFSRSKTDVKSASIGVKHLVDQVVMLLEPSFKKYGIFLEVQIPEQALVIANEDLLKQVLVNLLTNARDAVQETAEPKVTIHWHDDSMDVARIDVMDNGTGISDSIKLKIFDPFFTSKPAGKGTGLGLSISKEMAQKMGGDLILAESQPHHTCFTINLNKASE